MKKLVVVCAVATLSGCVMPGMPGMDPMGGMTNAAMADSVSQAQTQQANMMAAQSAAQASAARPGDDAKSCDALQAEMAATMNDPQVQSAIASMGASAQAQQDRAKAAQAGAVAGAATSTALGIAGSFIPGLSWFSQGAMMAQQANAVSQMNAANRDRSKMMTDISSVMPQLYRGQHLYDLATRKNCSFTKQPPA
jgi:hypothetical protein